MYLSIYQSLSLIIKHICIYLWFLIFINRLVLTCRYSLEDWPIAYRKSDHLNCLSTLRNMVFIRHWKPSRWIYLHHNPASKQYVWLMSFLLRSNVVQSARDLVTERCLLVTMATWGDSHPVCKQKLKRNFMNMHVFSNLEYSPDDWLLHCITNNRMNEACLEKNSQDQNQWRLHSVKRLVILVHIKKLKAIPVTGREGPWGCETSRLPHFL
jgi:hypothetical protein